MEAPIRPTAAHRPAPETQIKDEFSGTEGVYLLPHHQEEIKRLQRQHFFIKAATDDKLTSVELPKGARVLDSGCADGECNPQPLHFVKQNDHHWCPPAQGTKGSIDRHMASGFGWH
jgi:hypothetical protein